MKVSSLKHRLLRRHPPLKPRVQDPYWMLVDSDAVVEAWSKVVSQPYERPLYSGELGALDGFRIITSPLLPTP